MKASNKLALYRSLAAAGLLWLIRKHKNAQDGIGKVERVKRRIYKEVSLAQDAGVDFQKKFADLSGSERDALIRLGQDVGWKQSKRAMESGKPYAESYYNSLRRAWNAVSGCEGIGRVYNVKNAQGNVVLTWIEDAQAHVDAEQRVLEAEKRAEEARKRLRKTRATTPTVAPAPTPKEHTLNQIRKDLLDKAKHMQVIVYDDYGYEQIITGDDRYNYLDSINYVVMIYDSIGDEKYKTTYPIRSYPKKEEAEQFAKHKRGHFTHTRIDNSTRVLGRRTCKVIPIDDVDIKSITGVSGIGYTPEVERELFEIWREELEYGYTELDYNTWRRIYGDEFAKAEVLPYMR